MSELISKWIWYIEEKSLDEVYYWIETYLRLMKINLIIQC